MSEFWTDTDTNIKYEVFDPRKQSPQEPGIYKVLRYYIENSTATKICYSRWTGKSWLLVSYSFADAADYKDTIYAISGDMYDSSIVKGWLKEVETPKDTSVSKIVSLMIEENDIDSAIAFLNAMKNNSVVETAQVLLTYLEKKCLSK